MEFGKVSNIEDVDWTVPADSKISLDFLTQNLANFQNEVQDFDVRFGAPAWGHKEWIGSVYPEKTKPSDFLKFYSRYFNCVELNTTHYRIPTLEQAKKWAAQTPDGFLFCPKVFQEISHSKTGLLDKSILKTWLDFLQNLGAQCGPSFIQFPPHFSYSERASLFEFLKNWPDAFELALEFRHSSWFQDGQVLPALTQYLQSRKIGLVITDVAGRRDVLHSSISSDFTMVRLIGNGLHPSDFSRAEVWIKRIENWRKSGLKRVFLFIHQPEDILAPKMTEFLLQTIKAKTNWRLDRPLKVDVAAEPIQIKLETLT